MNTYDVTAYHGIESHIQTRQQNHKATAFPETNGELDCEVDAKGVVGENDRNSKSLAQADGKLSLETECTMLELVAPDVLPEYCKNTVASKRKQANRQRLLHGSNWSYQCALLCLVRLSFMICFLNIVPCSGNCNDPCDSISGEMTVDTAGKSTEDELKMIDKEIFKTIRGRVQERLPEVERIPMLDDHVVARMLLTSAETSALPGNDIDLSYAIGVNRDGDSSVGNIPEWIWAVVFCVLIALSVLVCLFVRRKLKKDDPDDDTLGPDDSMHIPSSRGNYETFMVPGMSWNRRIDSYPRSPTPLALAKMNSCNNVGFKIQVKPKLNPDYSQTSCKELEILPGIQETEEDLEDNVGSVGDEDILVGTGISIEEDRNVDNNPQDDMA